MSTTKSSKNYDDVKINTKFIISSLWTSTMFCYIYCDYFELYVPKKLEGMIAGLIQPLGHVTQGILLGTSILMAIPSIMIFLSLVLKSKVNRFVNIVIGTIYTIIMLLVILMASWRFYVFFGLIEVVLTTSVVWYAWNWSKQESV